MFVVDSVRTLLHKALSSPALDSLGVVRVPKELARGVNDLLGRPLCSAEELASRRAAHLRLAELRRGPRTVTVAREPAPVTVYFEKDRNARELARIQEILAARGITPRLCDVAGDASTIDFVLRSAKTELDRLPVVFVGDKAIGTRAALVAHDVSGALQKDVFG